MEVGRSPMRSDGRRSTGGEKGQLTSVRSAQTKLGSSAAGSRKVSLLRCCRCPKWMKVGERGLLVAFEKGEVEGVEELPGAEPG